MRDCVGNGGFRDTEPSRRGCKCIVFNTLLSYHELVALANLMTLSGAVGFTGHLGLQEGELLYANGINMLAYMLMRGPVVGGQR